MLTGTVYPCKRLLVKQAAHTMSTCNLLQNTHHDLVVILCDIDRCIDRSQLVLCRSNLVVLCLRSDAKLPALLIDFLHICTDTLTDRTKIMVIHLLSLWWHRTKQCTSSVDQVLTL